MAPPDPERPSVSFFSQAPTVSVSLSTPSYGPVDPQFDCSMPTLAAFHTTQARLDTHKDQRICSTWIGHNSPIELEMQLHFLIVEFLFLKEKFLDLSAVVCDRSHHVCDALLEVDHFWRAYNK